MSRDEPRITPSFTGLFPASARTTAAARGASKKTGTRCEVILRRELWRRGLRYRLHITGLPGRPDIVFAAQRVAIFCDGDFWHGRDLDLRLEKLALGHNADYWTAKIKSNTERDALNTRALEADGWAVLRFWETDVLRETREVADRIAGVLADRVVGRATAAPRGVPRSTAAAEHGEASRGSSGTPAEDPRSDPAGSQVRAPKGGRCGGRG